MSVNKKLALAALAGLLTSGVATATVAHAAEATDSAKSAVKDVHACAGKNSCKGNGGCKTGDNGCKAKNSCKGKGGCATDGSKDTSKKAQ